MSLDIDEVTRALADEDIVLILADAEEYVQVNNQILDLLTTDMGLNGIYVTVNKPYETLVNELADAGIDTSGIFFIDAISRQSGIHPSAEDNAAYLESPQNLTDLSIAMTEAYEGMKEQAPLFIFLDSLSTLTIYNSFDSVSQFAHFFTGKLRNWKVKGVLISVEEEADEELIDQLSQFCDSVIRASD